MSSGTAKVCRNSPDTKIPKHTSLPNVRQIRHEVLLQHASHVQEPAPKRSQAVQVRYPHRFQTCQDTSVLQLHHKDLQHRPQGGPGTGTTCITSPQDTNSQGPRRTWIFWQYTTHKILQQAHGPHVTTGKTVPKNTGNMHLQA